MIGFRRSRIGPVMDVVGICQTSLPVALHFRRNRDVIVSIVKSLLHGLGYGTDDPNLRDRMIATFHLHRGLNIEQVQR